MEKANKEYQQFGKKTFFIFTLKRSPAILCILFFLAVLSAVPRFLPDPYSEILAAYIPAIIPIGLIAAIGVFLIISSMAWLEYTHYGILIGENNFKVKKGVLNVMEIGTPYRYVKEVRIQRTLSDQVIGVSSVVIEVLGEEDEQSVPDESEIILPSIDKDVAIQIQDSILRRSEIEKFNIVRGGQNDPGRGPQGQTAG
ncbi:MAG: PH domain-containing protein [Candidatus Paceibacterota bacterium]|jgi:uncharacterized membrane protein YdbT with pleckstrin-like domain